MPIDTVSALQTVQALQTALTYSVGVIGVLLSLLIALVMWVFLSLKSEVRSIAVDVRELSVNHASLIRREDCHATTGRIYERLDDYSQRIARLETYMEKP